MKIKKYEELNKINEELDLTEYDLKGGINLDEYDEVIKYIQKLKGKADPENPFRNDEELTIDEKIISEILYNIVKHPERGYDYNTYYHRRKGFVNANKDKSMLN